MEQEHTGTEPGLASDIDSEQPIPSSEGVESATPPSEEGSVSEAQSHSEPPLSERKEGEDDGKERGERGTKESSEGGVHDSDNATVEGKPPSSSMPTADERDPPSSQSSTAALQSKPAVFGSASGPSELSFAALASGSSSSAFPIFGQKTEGFKFAQSVQPLFSRRRDEEGGGGGKGGEHEDPESEVNISFQPIVTLPEAVKVKSWDEDADVMFSQRAKLFRFDSNSSQWKERGIGELKILKHHHTQKVKLIMRRDQILKLCCNHNLTADMSLKPLATSEKTWTWFTSADYTDEVVKPEKLAAKFKNVQIAAEFKEVFDRCRAGLATPEEGSEEREGEGSEEGEGEGSSQQEEEETTSLPAMESLASRFSTPPDTWECPTCYVRNASSLVLCQSCQGRREGGPHPSSPSSGTPTDCHDNREELHTASVTVPSSSTDVDQIPAREEGEGGGEEREEGGGEEGKGGGGEGDGGGEEEEGEGEEGEQQTDVRQTAAETHAMSSDPEKLATQETHSNTCKTDT